MKYRKLALLIIAISFVAAFYYYPMMPDQMASHWNSAGEVDGYMSKAWGLFMMPLISLLLYVLFHYLPKWDPLGKNVKKFKTYYDGFVLALVVFFAYIYGLSLAWNLGYMFKFTLYMVPAMAGLFYYLGILIEHSERNWFVGIRTPWTLSSAKSWEKTHELGGKLFKLVAVVSLFGLVWRDYAIWLLVIPLLIVVIYLFYYSYRVYKHDS